MKRTRVFIASLFGAYAIFTGQGLAATQMECTVYKMCVPRTGCEDVTLPIQVTASNSDLRMGDPDDELVLKRVLGKLGAGVTYATLEAPDTYNVVTLRPDMEMYMSSHKNTKYGGLSTMNLRCEVK